MSKDGRARYPPPPGGRWRAAAAALTVLALTLTAFHDAGSLDFIESYDDGAYLLKNPVVRQGLTPDGVRWAFTKVGYSANWHPLTWLSHMLDVQLFGLEPRGHHLVNLAFHSANAVLLLLVLRALTGALWRALVVAALFAIHPLHVQSVAWVAERKDVLSTLFWVATLWAYLRHARRPGRARLSLVVATFGLGLLAKPMLVTLPFALLLLDYWPLGRIGDGRGGPSLRAAAPVLLEKVPLLLLAAASSAMTLLAQQRAISAVKSIETGTRLINALLAYAGYLGQMLWPAGLAVYYPLAEGVAAARVVAAGALLALLALGAWLARHSRPALTVGWLWYLGTLVPVIGLVKVGGQLMADRYTYVPLVGLFIAAVWGAGDLLRRPRPWLPVAAGSAALVIIGLLLPLTLAEVGHWKNGLTLFGRALQVTSGNWVAERNYGTALLHAGRAEEALPHLIESVHLSPDAPDAAYNLGVGFFRLGRKDQAAAAFRETLRLDPAFADAHYNLGVGAAEDGDLGAAIARFRETIRLAPEHFEARYNLGLALERSGKRGEALEHYREASRIDPGDGNARAAVRRLLGKE